ncbi:MAG: proliferating cell nuclear antigen (pcna) [archaeon]
MFKASFADARVWKNLLSAIAALVEDADFEVSPQGVKLRAMDPSHVAMVDFEWPASAFEEYTCQAQAKIRLNVNSMLKLLRRVTSDERLDILYDESTKKIDLTLKGQLPRKFTMPTLEPSEEEVPTPKIEFKTKAKMVSGDLTDIVEDCQQISDNVRLESTQDKLIVSSSGDLSSYTAELTKNTEKLLEFEVQEPSKATFSLNYLAEIVKAASSTSEIVSLEFASNMPVRLLFDIPQQGHLQYYLAPRIEPE